MQILLLVLLGQVIQVRHRSEGESTTTIQTPALTLQMALRSTTTVEYRERGARPRKPSLGPGRRILAGILEMG